MEGNSKLIAFMAVALVIGAAAGIGTGFAIWGSETATAEKDYNFYLYFGEGDADNKWYSAKAANTNDAFDRAMKSAGFEYEKSNWGYISTINGKGEHGWYLCEYLYSEYSPAAQDGSTNGKYENYGTLQHSNGWKIVAGYDDGSSDLKLDQFSSTTYFFSVYKADYSAESPVSIDAWKNSGPFAA